MKKLAIIISHCDTDEKRNILRETISKLKKIDLDILLFSHIPVSRDIQDSINYLIIDTSNPILTMNNSHITMNLWLRRIYKGKKIELVFVRPDYGWTVFNQIKKSGIFSKSLDYDYFYLVNYDMDLNDKTLKYFQLTETNLLSSSVNTTNDHFFPSIVFNGFKREVFFRIADLIKKVDYMATLGPPIHGNAEVYLNTLTSDIDYKKVEVNDLLSISSLDDTFNYSKNDNFKIFFITHFINEDLDGMIFAYKNFKIYIYDIKEIPTIKYDDTIFTLENKEDIIIDLPKSYLEVDNIGYELDNQYYDLTKFLKCDDIYKMVEFKE